MRFLGSKFTQNALAWTPLGELKRSPDPLPISGGRKGKGGERGRRERRYWGRRYWGRERGREGKRKGGGRERKGRGVCVIGVRVDRRPCTRKLHLWNFPGKAKREVIGSGRGKDLSVLS